MQERGACDHLSGRKNGKAGLFLYLLKGDKDAVKGYSYSYGETTNGPTAATICGKLNSTVTGSNTGSKVTVAVADPTDDKTAAAQNELLKALQKSGARITIAAGVSGDAAKVAISVDGYDVDSNGKVSKDGVATGVTLSASAGVNNEKGTTALSDRKYAFFRDPTLLLGPRRKEPVLPHFPIKLQIKKHYIGLKRGIIKLNQNS